MRLCRRTFLWTTTAGVVAASADPSSAAPSDGVRTVAHNPGDWLFHCHEPMHMMGGMVSLVRVG